MVADSSRYLLKRHHEPRISPLECPHRAYRQENQGNPGEDVENPVGEGNLAVEFLEMREWTRPIHTAILS